MMTLARSVKRFVKKKKKCGHCKLRRFTVFRPRLWGKERALMSFRLICFTWKFHLKGVNFYKINIFRPKRI